VSFHFHSINSLSFLFVGAGKTTLFKLLVGDLGISAGDAYVQGISTRKELQSVHKMMGYCPQFDALDSLDLTGRQALKVFALLRGIEKADIELTCAKLATDLGFSKHFDKNIKTMSGGNKRKLSAALALLADSPLILLDEPTSGVDVAARRKLWKAINKTKSSGRSSVVLSSHSMDECEALCSKMAIMVNGEFKCLGSTQHLKNRFSNGFILTVKMGLAAITSEDRREIIKNEVQQMFPSAELKESYLDVLAYHIKVIDLKLSEVFGMLQTAKEELDLEDYAVAQTSLEQVFLFFSKTGIYQRN